MDEDLEAELREQLAAQGVDEDSIDESISVMRDLMGPEVASERFHRQAWEESDGSG